MPIFSSHIFHFPFCFNNNQGNENFKTVIPEHWARVSLRETASYNEYVYFYNQIRSVLFPGKDNDDICWYFEHSINDKSSYIINIKNDENYELLIQKISLRIFNGSTGILSIHLHNETFEKLDDILKINEFGRRIYPQYLGDEGTDSTKESFLADSITLNIAGEHIEEKFLNENYNKNEVVFPEHIKYLLGYKFVEQYKPAIIIDDRMFTVCWFGNNDLSGELKTKPGGENKYLSNTQLYKFVCVDGKNPLIANTNMKEELLEKTIYKRWTDYGSFFGCTRYSFMALTDRTYFNYNFVRNHVETLYSEMTVILLVQRAALLNFSNEIVELSKEIKDKLAVKNFKLTDENILRAKKLQSDFLNFISTIYFTEVTPQEQGIELFDMMRQDLRLNETVEEIRAEINGLFSYIDLNIEKNNSREMESLTKLGAIFLPLTLITGIWGMNIYFLKKFNENIFHNNELISTGITILMFILTGMSVVFFTRKLLKREDDYLNDNGLKNSLKKDILRAVKDPLVIITLILSGLIFIITYLPPVNNFIREVFECIN